MKWVIVVAAVTVPLVVSGCTTPRESAAEASASASPSATAAPMEVDQGVDEINIAVGQSVDFQTQGEVQWTAASSDEAVFRVFSPSEDPFTPNTPGGVGQAPGEAMVTMTLPTNGFEWEVKVRVIDPAASNS